MLTSYRWCNVGFGFTLSEIGEMIALYEADLITCADNIPKIQQKVEVINAKIRQLEAIQMPLLNCISNSPGACEIEDTLERLKAS
ncbi:MAG TPA: MerR family DNA-binding protein [Flavisolibacter sp.]|nr:MerR family DNA-binding protein [Flavisolibacter sp.]